MNIALIKNNIIKNVIVAETLEDVISIHPDYEHLVLVENDSKGIGWYKENEQWLPPKLDNTCVWDEKNLRWLMQEDVEAMESTELPPYIPSVSP